MRSQRLASPLRGLLLLLLGVLVGANATYFLMTRDAVSPASLASGPATDSVARQAGPPESAGAEIAQPPAEPVLPPPVARINGTAAGSGSPSATAHAQANGAGLLLPVQGIAPSQLTDTFTDARSAGRSHATSKNCSPASWVDSPFTNSMQTTRWLTTTHTCSVMPTVWPNSNWSSVVNCSVT
jgi:hypothetical protein